MSEGEGDLLSEKLGDGIGAQAKRRKDIEEIGEKAIGAEIKKTEETLRERVGASGSRSQRSGLGSLSLTMAVLCLLGGQVSAFTTYDCSNSSNIMTHVRRQTKQGRSRRLSTEKSCKSSKTK
jgi:hypothetical protein